jgi:sodium transport system ATP-binding protein
MQEVGALCDHIVVIAKGRVTAQGSPDQLLKQTGESTLEDAFVKAIGADEEHAA